MESIEYLTALRRHWNVVVMCVLVAGLVGWFTAPSEAEQRASDEYEATVTLIPARDATAPVNLYLAANLVTNADVVTIAAEALQYPGDPAELAATVSAAADPDALIVTVEATAPNAQLASATATAFANGVMQFLGNSQQQLNETKKAELQAELDSVNTRVSELQAQIAGANEGLVPILTARRDAEVARYGQLYGQLQQLNNAPAESGLETLGSPSLGDHSGGGLPVPVRPVPRALVFGAVGLLLGAIAAVIVSRLDTRLRRRPDIEAAFDAPVIAEIPRVRLGQRRREIFVNSRSHSVDAEAYRSLRFAILRQGGRRRAGGPRQTRVIMMTSVAAREGKSSTTSNLAAALAEVGMNVLVIDCDFRNPEMQDYLDANGTVGLSELLARNDDINLGNVARQTSIPGVRLVTNGSTPGTTAALVMRFAEVVESARAEADIVLVDSAPLLVASESLDIAQHVDAALVVSRVGRDTSEKASQLIRLLKRAEASVLGVVLVGTSRPSVIVPYRGSAMPPRSDMSPAPQPSASAIDPAEVIKGYAATPKTEEVS